MASRVKPLQFLKEQVRGDIQAWLDAQSDRDADAYRECPKLVDAGYRDGEVIKTTLNRILGIAFDHPDGHVRGCAWLRFVEIYKGSPELKGIIEIYANSMFHQKFLVDQTEVDDTWISIWIESLLAVVEARTCISLIQNSARDRLNHLAGPDLALMTTHEGSSKFLSDPSPAKRIAAILTIRTAANLAGVHSISKLIEMASTDPEMSVRITAVRSIVELKRNSPSPGILAFLAAIVIDRSLPDLIREVAYQGLYEISDRPVTEWPIMRSCLGGYTFPEDIDFSFVSLCLRTGKAGQDAENGERPSTWESKV